MRKVVFLVIAMTFPFGLLRADQGPLEKAKHALRKVAEETGDAIYRGAKATGQAVGKGLQKVGNTIRRAAS